MIGLGILRGVFFGGIMMWYSMSVWKTVDQYFRDQFQEYLTKEYQDNQAMRQDVLVEKEKLAARKIMLERLKKLEESESMQLPPEFSEGVEEGKMLDEDGARREGDPRWLEYAEHGGYSAEEVEGENGFEDAREDVETVDGYQVAGGGSEVEEDAGTGECLVEECGGHDDRVTTRWRNVFEEEGDVCHFDEHHFGAEAPCSQEGGDVWEESEAMDGD